MKTKQFRYLNFWKNALTAFQNPSSILNSDRGVCSFAYRYPRISITAYWNIQDKCIKEVARLGEIIYICDCGSDADQTKRLRFIRRMIRECQRKGK